MSRKQLIALLLAGGITGSLALIQQSIVHALVVYAQEAEVKEESDITIQYLKGEDAGKDGYFAIAKTVDDQGRVIQETFLDENEAPVLSVSKGYATIRKEYDDAGNVIKEQ